MTTSTRIPGASVPFQDPRQTAGFIARHYPTANGRTAPTPDSQTPNDRIVIEFLAAYYALNCEYSRLLHARNIPNAAERSEKERRCLQEVEKALIVRDGLEDRYAPFGVIAEPVVKEGFATDIKVSFGNIDAAGKARSELYTITAFVPIPMPPGAKFEDLPLRIEGPGINPD